MERVVVVVRNADAFAARVFAFCACSMVVSNCRWYSRLVRTGRVKLARIAATLMRMFRKSTF